MPYESNELIELKREALIRNDIGFLRRIKAYEEVEFKPFYFRKEERVFMDALGNITDPDDLPAPTYWPHYDKFSDIEFGRKMYRERVGKKERPGELFRTIELMPDLQRFIAEAWIYEVPESTIFPLCESYSWYLACAKEPELEIDKTQEIQIKGREHVSLHLYWNQFGHRELSIKKPFQWEKYSLKENI